MVGSDPVDKIGSLGQRLEALISEGAPKGGAEGDIDLLNGTGIKLAMVEMAL